MDNDLHVDLDFQGHIIWYSLAIDILGGKKGSILNIIFFVFIKSTVLRYFLMLKITVKVIWCH